MPFSSPLCRACVLLALASPFAAPAKPIAFQDGWTLMSEYGTNTMREAQVFYAPKYWWSGGLSYTKLIADDGSIERAIPNVQVNYLVKRWNLPSAQGNFFVWGGLGAARGFDAQGSFSGIATPHAGGQVDYETRSIYASLKTDWFARAASRIASTRSSSASLPTSTTTKTWRRGSWCRPGATRAASCPARPR